MIQRTARSLRAIPIRPRTIPSAHRFASSSSRSHIKSQTTSGLAFAGYGVLGLVGWTAAIFAMGQQKPARHSTPHVAAPTPSPADAEVSEDASDASDAAPASQSAAYDPETGEINWACPCLGGMADGPCGEEFKAAFSCFVHSEDEPKGVDCVEKFRGMQECFRKHPDIYGSEGEEEELDEEELVRAAELALADREFEIAFALPLSEVVDPPALVDTPSPAK